MVAALQAFHWTILCDTLIAEVVWMMADQNPVLCPSYEFSSQKIGLLSLRKPSLRAMQPRVTHTKLN